MDVAETIEVEVAYARPERQLILAVTLERGACVREAVQASGILEAFPEIDLAVNRVGVFGHLCGLDRPLDGGDRVEIYRSLIADPKEVRRQRAAAGKPTRKGGGRTGDPDSR